MMTMPNSRGSWRSSRNSLRTTCIRRVMPIAAAGEATPAEHHDGEDRQRHEVVPEHRRSDALEQDAAQRHEEIPRRHDVRDHLQERRHARDRKDEAREHQRRQERRQQRQLKRHLLRLGDASRSAARTPARRPGTATPTPTSTSHEPRIGRSNSTIDSGDDAHRRDQRDDESTARSSRARRAPGRSATSAPAPSCRPPSRGRPTAPWTRRPSASRCRR